MIRIAILLQCHQVPEQVNLFLELMNHPAITFFVHVDKKSDIKERIRMRNNIILLLDELRVDVQWGNITQVDATLNLLNYAMEYGSFDFYWLCSGQDLPVKPVEEIVQWLSNRKESEFVELVQSRNNGLGHGNNLDKRNEIYFPIWMLGKGIWKKMVKRIWVEITGGYNKTFRMFMKRNTTGWKFYFGSCWICLTNQMVQWMKPYLSKDSGYYKFFETCNCPDESYFQTLVMNSPYAKNRRNYLHYVDWSNGGSNPKVLLKEDYEKIVKSGYLLARKFDIRVDKEIIDKIILSNKE